MEPFSFQQATCIQTSCFYNITKEPKHTFNLCIYTQLFTGDSRAELGALKMSDRFKVAAFSSVKSVPQFTSCFCYIYLRNTFLLHTVAAVNIFFNFTIHYVMNTLLLLSIWGIINIFCILISSKCSFSSGSLLEFQTIYYFNI